MNICFLVSDSPDRIEPAGEEVPSIYDSPESAGKAVTDGYHGEYGRKYILKVHLETVAEYDRPWALVRKDTGS